MSITFLPFLAFSVYIDGELRVDSESPTFYQSISSSADHLYKPVQTKTKQSTSYAKSNVLPQPSKTYLKAPSDYQSDNSPDYYDKPLASYSYTPSPYQRPLSYIKLISRLNDPYHSTPKPAYTSLYNEHGLQKTVQSSRTRHAPVPTVVISSSQVPLNLDMKTKSTKVKVSSSHENLPPEHYHTYSHNGKLIIEEEIIKPAVNSLREIILPPRHVGIKQIHHAKEENIRPHIITSGHYQENYKDQRGYQQRPESGEMEMVPEYEDVGDHHQQLPKPVHFYETTPPTYYDYGRMRPTEGNYMYFYK